MYSGAVADSHHHLWDLARFPYRWLAPDAPPRPFGDHSAIKTDYDIGSYLADMAGTRVSRSVHVQANCGAADPVEETAWLASVAQRTGRTIGVVGAIDPASPDMEWVLDRHMEHAGFRGVRVFAGWSEDPEWCQVEDPGYLRSEPIRHLARKLTERGLSLDVVVLPAQLLQLAELADDNAALPVIINHLGTLRTAVPGDIATWEKGIGRVAQHANVHIKLSGLWTVDRAWTPEVLAPYLRHVVDCFGVDRCMYGSNLPIEKLMAPATDHVAKLSQALADLDGPQLRSVFYDTAMRAYRLD